MNSIELTLHERRRDNRVSRGETLFPSLERSRKEENRSRIDPPLLGLIRLWPDTDSCQLVSRGLPRNEAVLYAACTPVNEGGFKRFADCSTREDGIVRPVIEFREFVQVSLFFIVIYLLSLFL